MGSFCSVATAADSNPIEKSALNNSPIGAGERRSFKVKDLELSLVRVQINVKPTSHNIEASRFLKSLIDPFASALKQDEVVLVVGYPAFAEHNVWEIARGLLTLEHELKVMEAIRPISIPKRRRSKRGEEHRT